MLRIAGRFNKYKANAVTRSIMTVQAPVQASIQALGYIGVRAKSLEDWATYGANFLGLQRIDKSRSSMAFRMDDRKQRLVVDADGGEGIGFFGWEVADAAALDALAARLEKHGTKVARGSRALADERHVKDLVVANDPAGNRLEFFHGAATASDPFKPGRNISGFRTGPLGMGHVVMHFERIADVMTFYQEVLEFKLSDYWLRPFPGYFFHVNPRHHSIALVETGKNMVHHMMVELFQLRRRRPGLRSGAGRSGEDRGHARPPLRRLRHLVLHLEPVGLHGRVRLGRAGDRRQHLEAVRAQVRPEPVGPRAALDVAGEARGGAAAVHRGRRERPAPAGAGDRGQLQPHARRLPVVGQHEGAAEGELTATAVMPGLVRASDLLA